MSPLPRRTPVLRPSLRTSLRTLFVTTLSVAVASVALSAPAHAENRVTPGDFTGYGFDQCLAPTQAKMDAWMENSPFTAVGIYISGASRACRSQPNLTTTWISTQLREGLEAAADHPRPAELVRRPVPAVRRLDRPDDQGELDQLVRRRAQAGHRRGEVRGRRGEGSRHHRRQHALVRPRGLVERQRRLLPRVRTLVPPGLDHGGARPRLRVGRLLQRRLRHGHPRQRPQDPARLRAPRQDLDRPLGRRGQHLHVLHQ